MAETETTPNPCTMDRIQEAEEEIPSKMQAIETLTDRLSELPDPLILHILHLLDSTKQAVRTSALSKRWRNLWTCTQSFNFKHHEYFDRTNVADFISFVTKALLIQCMDNVKINSFRIAFKLEQRFEAHLVCWVAYLLCHQVEELDIDLHNLSSGCHQFRLPNEIFSNSVFSKLRLGYCIWDPDRQIDWKALRVLCIGKSYVNEDLIENIMCGSPLLESLELDSCYGFNYLDITSASVKKFIFRGYDPEDDGKDDLDDMVEIYAPNILSLDMVGTFLLWKVVLVDVSSLVEAKLNYTKLGYWELNSTRKRTKDEMLKGIIQRLHHVKDVTVGYLCSASVLRLQAKGFSFPPNVKCPDLTSPCYTSSDSEYGDLGYPVIDHGPDDEEIDTEPEGEDVDRGPDGRGVDHGPDGEEIDSEPEGEDVDHGPDGDGVDNGTNHDEAAH